uniref:Serpin domain-containing protein n=1 Tax=Anguilla anguilla TaxID=7936 RepID=A0A0E9SPK2_ANGAN
MKRYYLSEGFSTDFSKTEQAKEQINKYVDEKTKGKITQLVENVDTQNSNVSHQLHILQR